MKLTDEIRLAIRRQLTAPPGQSRRPRRQTRTGAGGYRHASQSLAVEPEQVCQVRDLYKLHAVGGDVEHTADGIPVFTSAEQFQRACKARGLKTGRDGFEQIRNKTGREPKRAQQRIREKYLAHQNH